MVYTIFIPQPSRTISDAIWNRPFRSMWLLFWRLNLSLQPSLNISDAIWILFWSPYLSPHHSQKISGEIWNKCFGSIWLFFWRLNLNTQPSLKYSCPIWMIPFWSIWLLFWRLNLSPRLSQRISNAIWNRSFWSIGPLFWRLKLSPQPFRTISSSFFFSFCLLDAFWIRSFGSGLFRVQFGTATLDLYGSYFGDPATSSVGRSFPNGAISSQSLSARNPFSSLVNTPQSADRVTKPFSNLRASSPSSSSKLKAMTRWSEFVTDRRVQSSIRQAIVAVASVTSWPLAPKKGRGQRVRW